MPGNSRSSIMETMMLEHHPTRTTAGSPDIDARPASTSRPEEVPVEQIPIPEETMDLNPDPDNKLHRCNSTPAAASTSTEMATIVEEPVASTSMGSFTLECVRDSSTRSSTPVMDEDLGSGTGTVQDMGDTPMRDEWASNSDSDYEEQYENYVRKLEARKHYNDWAEDETSNTEKCWKHFKVTQSMTKQSLAITCEHLFRSHVHKSLQLMEVLKQDVYIWTSLEYSKFKEAEGVSKNLIKLNQEGKTFSYHVHDNSVYALAPALNTIYVINDKDLRYLGIVRTSNTRMPFNDKRGKPYNFPKKEGKKIHFLKMVHEKMIQSPYRERLQEFLSLV